MWRCPQAGEDTHTEACMHGVGEDAHRSDPSERYTSEVVGVARWTRDERGGTHATQNGIFFIFAI
jgi:hypothetical protein